MHRTGNGQQRFVDRFIDQATAMPACEFIARDARKLHAAFHVQGEHTLLTELSQFREADGTYRHVLEGAGDGLATAQSVLALVAVQRVRSGQPWVLHFDGTQAPREASGTNGIICAVIGAVVVIAAGAIYIIGRKRKKA